MKLKTRLLSICTVVALTVATLAMTAFADDPTSVRINQGNRELQKGRSLKLSVTVLPRDSNDTLDFWSDEPDIVDVDGDGVCEALDYGTATIHVETVNGKKDSITITVPDPRESSQASEQDSGVQDTDSSSSRAASSSRASSSTTATTSGTIEMKEKIDRETLVSAVQGAGSGRATLSNYAAVSAESLQAAAAAGNAGVNFDTKSGSTVVGRVVVSPANAANLTGDISLGVYAKNAKTQSVQNVFDRYYSNNVTVIRCDQNDFGMTVEVVAKVGNLNADSLKFYSYSSSGNTYSDLTVSNVSVDKSGYVHFNTTKGGYIVVSDGALAKK